jgi:hypothetical protein
MRRALVAVALVVLVAAGCSSDDGLTKSQFVAKGDAICKRLADESGKVAQPADEAGIDEYLVKVLRIADEARADFAALDPPKDGEAVQRAVLTSLDGTIAQARKAKAAAAENDLAGVQKALQDASAVAAKGNKAATGYGFQECSNS